MRLKKRAHIWALAIAIGLAFALALYADYGRQANVIQLGLEWELIGYDAQGQVIAHRQIREGVPLRWFLITDVGFNNLIRKAVGQSSGQPAGAQWVGIGTGSTCTAADTTLAGETARAAATYSEPATKQFRETATFGPVSGITNAGAFNAAVAGVLLSCQTFASITADTLEVRITYTLT